MYTLTLLVHWFTVRTVLIVFNFICFRFQILSLGSSGIECRRGRDTRRRVQDFGGSRIRDTRAVRVRESVITTRGKLFRIEYTFRINYTGSSEKSRYSRFSCPRLINTFNSFNLFLRAIYPQRIRAHDRENLRALTDSDIVYRNRLGVVYYIIYTNVIILKQAVPDACR